jgi:hypothetical protein
MHLDDAIQFLINLAKGRHRPTDYAKYGYEIHLRDAVLIYWRDVEQVSIPRDLKSQEAEKLAEFFYDAAWELCRRGIFRPSVKHILDQGEAGGRGYSVTAAGRVWLERADEALVVPMEPSRFAQRVEKFRARLGDGFFQRAQEAIRCHFATTYLACCAMCGSATESILLRVAIAKTGDEQEVLRVYRSASGRRQVESIVVGRLREPLASQFRNLTDLLKYWRDEAAHGVISDISEFEAHEALARLLRFAHFVDDHWNELVA